nr:sigma-70 family RNA polymerase sigma factor [Verrucomicrobium spinosum]
MHPSPPRPSTSQPAVSTFGNPLNVREAPSHSISPRPFNEGLPPHLANEQHINDEIARHASRIRTYVRSLMPGYDGADDVAQETLLKIWQKRAEFSPGTNFKAWAFQIARFLVKNQQRRLARSRTTVLDEEMTDHIDECWKQEPVPNIDDDLSALAFCIQQLGKEDQLLLQARYFNGSSLQKYAAANGLPVTVLRSRLFRLRTTLARNIEQHLRR